MAIEKCISCQPLGGGVNLITLIYGGNLHFSTSFTLRFWSLRPRLLTYRNFTHLFGIDRPSLGNMYNIWCPPMALSYFKNTFFTKYAKKSSFFLKIVITLTWKQYDRTFLSPFKGFIWNQHLWKPLFWYPTCIY